MSHLAYVKLKMIFKHLNGKKLFLSIKNFFLKISKIELLPGEKRTGTFDKELLAIFAAMKRWK